MTTAATPARLVYAIRLLATATPPPPGSWETYPAWLKDCDHEAADGRGIVMLCSNAGGARLFTEMKHAVAFYQRVPQCRPLRPDGFPNRPLTAYTVEVLGLQLARVATGPTRELTYVCARCGLTRSTISRMYLRAATAAWILDRADPDTWTCDRCIRAMIPEPPVEVAGIV